MAKTYWSLKRSQTAKSFHDWRN